MSEETASKENDTGSFIDNADECMEPTPASETGKHQPLLQSLIGSSVLNIYDLDEKDLRVVAILFERLLDGENEMRTGHLLKSLEKDKIAAFREIKRIVRLREMGVLEGTSRSEDDGDSAGALLRSTLRLSSNIVDQICNPSIESTVIVKDTYKDNLDYLVDQFEKIRLILEIKGIATGRRMWNRSGSDRRRRERDLEKLEGRIKEKLSKTDICFPLELLKKEENLTHKEELIVIALLRSEILQDRRWEVEDLLDLISGTPYERLKDSKLFEGKERLIKDEFIEIESVPFPVSRCHVILHKDIKTKLLGEEEESNRDLSDDFFEIIKPAVSLDKIILHNETRDQITLALRMIQGNVPHRLKSWGIRDDLQTKTDKTFLSSVKMLFYGPPGTGKTLTANAMACMLKRYLVTLDCSKILDKYVGASEKNTRRIFDRYREISKKMKRPPVLLLNEADQFLHRRIGATRSTDHMYNQMQNIFLEQLERFEGVLVATTNLLENLDAAFSRRFQHKIEFRRPGSVERLKLWQIHLSESAPLADDVNIEYLADIYDLSGGQIAVVIRNAAARAAMRGDKLSQEDFILVCENEIANSFDEKAKRRIGF